MVGSPKEVRQDCHEHFKKITNVISFRLGFALAGRCRPKMVINRPAHELTFKEIQVY
jgi:hypothetical protein